MLTIQANAKINLTLDILGIREDGYHEVAMVMQSVNLQDTLRLQKIDAGIELTANVPRLPLNEKNLAWKAAKLLLDTGRIAGGVRIELTKRIPVAAGLAGGSADAAAVLRGMNALYELHLSENELCSLGEKIGSDVPFCILGGTMLATGRGEILTRLPDVPECFVVLAKPPFSVSTAWAYRTYDAVGAKRHPETDKIQQEIQRRNWKGISKLLCNVLESVTIKKHREILRYKKLMRENGAMASMMSGSGPTVFAVVREKAVAERMASALRAATNAAVFVAKTVGKN